MVARAPSIASRSRSCSRARAVRRLPAHACRSSRSLVRAAPPVVGRAPFVASHSPAPLLPWWESTSLFPSHCVSAQGPRAPNTAAVSRYSSGRRVRTSVGLYPTVVQGTNIATSDSICRELCQAPGTDWTRVIENLDHDGFNVPDEAPFCLLMSIYSRACKDPFPLHAVCGFLWKNMEGQLSFLRHTMAMHFHLHIVSGR